MAWEVPSVFGFGIEMFLVALSDDLHLKSDRSACLLSLLELLFAFDTINCGILLKRLAEFE